MRQYLPPYARTIPSQAKRVFEGVMFDVYQWPQTMFDGSTATFEMAKRPDTVEVLCLVDDKLLVLHQQQPGSALYYDLPSGAHDIELETELEAAQREVTEETGWSFANWRLIECRQKDFRIERLVYTFLAWAPTQYTQPQLDNGEKIEVKPMTLQQAKALIDASGPRSQEYDFLAARFWYHLNSFQKLLDLPDLTVQARTTVKNRMASQ